MDLRSLLGEPTPIPAFNINDQFDLAAVVEALRVKGRPGIVLVSMNAIAAAGLEFLHDMVDFHRRRTPQPLFLGLDHCAHEATLLRAAELDFDLVMADFSHLALADNIDRVARLTELLRAGRCLVEAAPTPIPNGGAPQPRPDMTSPDRVRTFAGATGCHLVAPHLGTVHGFERHKPPIDEARVAGLVAASPVPLAAHGCDFLTPDQLAALTRAGVRKINIGPQLRVAWCAAARSAWAGCDLRAPDQRRIHAEAGRAVRADAEAIIDALARGDAPHPARRA